MKIKLKKPLTFVKSSSIITFALQESNVNIISKNNSEKYSRGRRGAPAKGVGRETGARVQIPPSPFFLFNGPLVKRLRHRPFTAVTRVRVPYGS